MLYNFYKITNEDGRVYIGSTIQPLNLRLNQHRYGSKSGGLRCCSSKQFNFDTCKIELIEAIEFEDKKEALFHEKSLIQNNECININNPYTTKEERREQNRKSRERHKEYHIQRLREYRQRNKEKLSEKIQCECGSFVARRNISTHRKSQKHKNLMIKNGRENETPCPASQ